MQKIQPSQPELIDTLWNVNETLALPETLASPGINRYIMECKLSTTSIKFVTTLELIDTLWNVNPIDLQSDIRLSTN